MRATKFPTLRLRSGALQRHARWDHSRALLDGTIADIAPRLARHGFPGVHIKMLDGLSEPNRIALRTLSESFPTLIAEGAIGDARGFKDAIASGATIVIVEPSAVDDPAMEMCLDAGDPPPLLAVGVVPEATPMRTALSRGWSGVVLDASFAEETRAMRDSVQAWDAELVVRVPVEVPAGVQLDVLNAFASLDVPLLIDVEFFIEMTRARFEFVVETYGASD
jgi:hypothetical protein